MIVMAAFFLLLQNNMHNESFKIRALKINVHLNKLIHFPFCYFFFFTLTFRYLLVWLW